MPDNPSAVSAVSAPHLRLYVTPRVLHAELAFGFADQQPWSADCAARLAIGRTWCPAAVWHARKAADAESVDSEYLACVRLAGQRVVVEVDPGGGDEQRVPAGPAERA